MENFPDILNYIKETFKMPLAKIEKEMLAPPMEAIFDQTSEVMNVLSWDRIAALVAYIHVPIDLEKMGLDAERKNLDQIVHRRGQILNMLREKGVFVDWGDFHNGSGIATFKAIDIIDKDSSLLLGTMENHYSFRSLSSALAFINSFEKFHRQLMSIVHIRKNTPFSAMELNLSLVTTSKEIEKLRDYY